MSKIHIHRSVIYTLPSASRFFIRKVGFFQDDSSEEQLPSYIEFASAVKFFPEVKPLEQHSKEPVK